MPKKRTKTGESLILKDEHGQARIILDASSDGLPFIVIKGAGGAKLALEVDGGDPRVVLSRSGGRHAVAIALSGDGSVIVLYEKSGLPAIKIAVDRRTNTPEITLHKNGQRDWTTTTKKKIK